MIKVRNALGFTIALAMASAPVLAATAAKPAAAKPAAAKVVVTKAVIAKPVAAKTVAAKPAAPVHVVAAKPAAKPAPVRVAAKPAGRLVTTKTSTGKTVTYNCSLTGNATKAACKG